MTRSLLFHTVYAVDWTPTLSGVDGSNDVATIGSVVPLFQNIIQAVLAFSGIILFAMLVFGGFTFLFSGGDPKQVQKAQGTISNAIIGLVVVLASYLILKTIEVFTGVNVTKFSLPQ